MNARHSRTDRPAGNRLTLEQKVRRLARRHRERMRRCQRRKQAGGRCRRSSYPWFPLISLLALFAVGSPSVSAAEATTFDDANQAYAAGHFVEAAHGFERVIAREGFSAPVLFNLGNAWLKAGEPGRAILNYERALVLEPQDAAVRANLRLAREKAGLDVPKPGTMERAVSALGWDTLAWIGVVALVAMCVLIFIGRIRPDISRGRLRLLIAGGAIVLVVVAAILAIRWPELNRAVVLEADAPARIAPAQSAGVSFKLQAGEIVQARKSHGGFVLVRTAEGQSGWVSNKLVAKIRASDHELQAAGSEPAVKSKKS